MRQLLSPRVECLSTIHGGECYLRPLIDYVAVLVEESPLVLELPKTFLCSSGIRSNANLV